MCNLLFSWNTLTLLQFFLQLKSRKRKTCLRVFALIWNKKRKGKSVGLVRVPLFWKFHCSLVPRVFVPLDQRSENERSASNHFEITEICPSVSLRSLHLWRMPEMVAPRAFFFRQLVKGNKDSGNEISHTVQLASQHNLFRTMWSDPAM